MNPVVRLWVVRAKEGMSWYIEAPSAREAAEKIARAIGCRPEDLEVRE